jgi:hypothetical protein
MSNRKTRKDSAAVCLNVRSCSEGNISGGSMLERGMRNGWRALSKSYVLQYTTMTCKREKSMWFQRLKIGLLLSAKRRI